jgi:hypothetical protein
MGGATDRHHLLLFVSTHRINPKRERVCAYTYSNKHAHARTHTPNMLTHGHIRHTIHVAHTHKLAALFPRSRTRGPVPCPCTSENSPARRPA